jgi:peptidoglycan/xylan/chitin deacetylase (PgdA/CDA1 family)
VILGRKAPGAILGRNGDRPRQRYFRGLFPALGALPLAVILALSPARAAEAPAPAPRPSSAVVFAYQRIGDDSVPQGSISVDQFKEHIRELKTGGYTVLPLGKIVDALKTGGTLPEKTVGISFDGAYASTLAAAVPLLDEAEMPFTVFFATDNAEGGVPSHMGWKQLKDLKKDKLASFGLLPSAYAHMISQTPAQNAALLNKAVGRYREELEEDPQFFAYPYGEYTPETLKQLAGYPFKAAFGQQSGVIHAKSDFLALPRFTMTDDFGGLDRFQLTARALPLPVTDVIPESMVIKDNPPMIGFTVTPDIPDISKLSCFISDVGKTTLARPGGGRVEIRLKEPLDERRTRVNCTMPDPASHPPAWRWFGMLLIAPTYEDDAVVPVVPGMDSGSDDDNTGND